MCDILEDCAIALDGLEGASAVALAQLVDYAKDREAEALEAQKRLEDVRPGVFAF